MTQGTNRSASIDSQLLPSYILVPSIHQRAGPHPATVERLPVNQHAVAADSSSQACTAQLPVTSGGPHCPRLGPQAHARVVGEIAPEPAEGKDITKRCANPWYPKGEQERYMRSQLLECMSSCLLAGVVCAYCFSLAITVFKEGMGMEDRQSDSGERLSKERYESRRKEEQIVMSG